MKKEIIRAEKIKKTFGNRPVLQDAWIQVMEGQVVGVAGLDGSGRTTLVEILAGLLKEDSGSLYYHGKKVEDGRREVLQKNIAYITHESSLVDTLSIIDNLFVINTLPKKPWYVSYKRTKETCKKVLETLHISSGYSRHCGRLEDNEKQRLEIMKEIMAGTRLIVLNCTGHVYSSQDILELKSLMEDTKKLGISYIFITNELDYIMDLSDVIFVLKEGRTIRELSRERFHRQQIYRFMSGYQVDDSLHVERKKSDCGQEVLALENVTMGLMRQVSFQVKSGEIVGVLSLSSRWNDNLMDVLMGNERIEGGQILRNGQEAGQKVLKNRGTLKNRCCVIPRPDLRKELYDNLTPQQNYVLLAQQKATLLSLGIVSGTIEKHLQNTKETELGFSPELFQKSVSEFSNKERFELVMGRIRLFKPDLLILNSPMEVADILLKKRVIRELVDIAEKGTGVLLTGANFDELTAFCDRILFQRNGRIRGNIGREEFFKIRLEDYLK